MFVRALVLCAWMLGLSSCGTITNKQPASKACVTGHSVIGQCTLG